MKMDKSNEKVYNVSQMMEKFGKYQKWQFFLACLSGVMATMININYVFVAGDLNYRCKILECEGQNSTAEFPNWWPSSAAGRCERPVLKQSHAPDGICTNDSFTTAVEACSSWIYESNDTIVAELNLACQPWKSNLIGTIHNFGMLFSMLISGWASDRFGRKPTLIVCTVGGCIGHFKVLATSYYVYTFIEFLESAMLGGTYAASMVLMIEISSKKNRVLAGVLFAYAVYLGESIFACIAMVVHYWKNLIAIIYTPPILVLSYIFLVKESPRWLLLNNKTDEVKKIFENIADMNAIPLNKQELASLDDAQLKSQFNIEKYEVKENIRNIFTSKEIMKRLLTVSVCRYTASFVYYGLMMNSIYLPGNKYTNFLLSTVMSFPGELMAMYLMNKIGRKLPLIIGYMICGVLCVITSVIPPDYVWAKITIFLIGKMFISVCFTGMITYAMELFPTSVRGSLISMGSFSSRIGAMLAPLTPMLVVVFSELPSVFFGACAVLSSMLLILTPETKNQPLMDTIQQIEDSKRIKREIKEDTSKSDKKKGDYNHGYSEEISTPV